MRYLLPQPVSKGQPCILCPRIDLVLFAEFAESQSSVKLPNQNQTSIRGDPRSLEIDLQRGIERELKGLALALTRWVWPSSVPSSRSAPYG